jgi:hypothetical protein
VLADRDGLAASFWVVEPVAPVVAIPAAPARPALDRPTAVPAPAAKRAQVDVEPRQATA